MLSEDVAALFVSVSRLFYYSWAHNSVFSYFSWLGHVKAEYVNSNECLVIPYIHCSCLRDLTKHKQIDMQVSRGEEGGRRNSRLKIDFCFPRLL